MAYEALYTRGRPKNFAQLIGQEHIATALTRAISNDRLSHAYLLVGTRGTGKTSTARLLSKAMNCERVIAARESGEPLQPKEIPCNKCASCLSYESSPDNVEFDAASNRSVEDVTRLLSTAYLAPLQSKVKTFIIDEVHMLSFEAVNSILKLIEEPPPNVAFFLATTEFNKVPMTIRSRCQTLNFRLIPRETIAPYLIRLAKRLEVELPEDAAAKIARLAEGSMRDAMTYLDQCYAMADKKISVEDVNNTLGLVSDSDLDEIISAVREKDRAKIATAITHAFRSGLTSVNIAESLITRLRDMEFEILDGRQTGEMRSLDILIDAMRKAVTEMQGSGIPDIILEMALMRLAAPITSTSNFAAPVSQTSSAPVPVVQNTSPDSVAENLDEGKKIFYDTLERFRDNDQFLYAAANNAIVVGWTGEVLTLGFKADFTKKLFEKHEQTLAQGLTETAGREVKIETIVNTKLPPPILDRLPEPDKSNLGKAMDIFNSSEAKKIEENE